MLFGIFGILTFGFASAASRPPVELKSLCALYLTNATEDELVTKVVEAYSELLNQSALELFDPRDFNEMLENENYFLILEGGVSERESLRSALEILKKFIYKNITTKREQLF